MRNLRFLLGACISLFFLSGCGEFAYKRGGQPAELAEVQSECRKTTDEGAAYENCMASRGWKVQNLELDPLLASTSINPDNRAAPPPEAGNVPAPAAPAADTMPSSAPVYAPAGVSVSAPVSASTSASPAKTTAAQDDPLQLLKINSMWKFGGTASQLQDATESCVATLGDLHRPVKGQQQLMTRALVSCLRGKGWYGASNR